MKCGARAVDGFQGGRRAEAGSRPWPAVAWRPGGRRPGHIAYKSPGRIRAEHCFSPRSPGERSDSLR